MLLLIKLGDHHHYFYIGAEGCLLGPESCVICCHLHQADELLLTLFPVVPSLQRQADSTGVPGDGPQRLGLGLGCPALSFGKFAWHSTCPAAMCTDLVEMHPRLDH